MQFLNGIISTGNDNGLYVIIFLILAIFWATENFLIQASLFDSPPVTLHPLAYQTVRLAINLSAAFLILLLANREWLLSIFLADFAVSLVVLAYREYFRRPFSFFYAIRNFREGLKVSSFALQLLPWKLKLAMVTCLACTDCPRPQTDRISNR